MTVYAPKYQSWHDDLPVACGCDPEWSGRGLVDDRCYHHRLIDAVEELAGFGWKVFQVDGKNWIAIPEEE